MSASRCSPRETAPRYGRGRFHRKRLSRYGCEVTRRTESRVKLTTTINGEHHVAIAGHKALRVGTLRAILKDVAKHLDLNWQVLARELFCDR